jgi:hypothetical protein
MIGPCIPLRFLVDPQYRAKKPGGMERFSESACFYRLHDLFWTVRQPGAIALLSTDSRAALDEFNQVFESLPWQVIESHPHISELPSDDLLPLVAVGKTLYKALQAEAARFGFCPEM